MEKLILEAEIREEKGSRGKLRALRDAQKIPAVIYGGKKGPIEITVPERALRKLTQSAGANAILTLKHPKGEDTVIIKEVSKHVVTHRPLHVDFQRISLSEKIVVKVHLKISGEAPGVKLQGGILEHILRELEVRCLPTAIPHEIPLDVTALGINEGLHVRDIKAPKDVEILNDPGQIVVNIVAPKAEEVAAPAEGAAAAEPEVIAKGKKEEEGAAAGTEAKAPEKGKPAEKAPEKGKEPAKKA